MHPLYIAFIWHMHQPLYRDPLSHYYMMPWVRLHGVKDYLDMVTILKRYPRLHQTFNLVPSLLEQIEDYASGEASDRYLTLSQIPVAELSREEKEEILLTFFDLNWDQMINPYARYRELSEQRAHFFQLYQSYYQAADHFSEQDWLDLTTWFNLAWIDPALCEQEPVLQALKHKGRGFNTEERRQVLAHHQLILQRILPAYRELSGSGQIELTTSPYYHPILPLLSDSDSARFSSTGIDLPRHHFQHPDDAYAQLQMAHRASEQYFGKAPKGLWPSEQSLSPEVLPLIARTGFEWVASSEGILWNTLSCQPHRNSQHILDIAEYLYRPYRVTHQGASLNIVFRDTYLSDQIGFNYWRGDNERNAHQLYHQLKAIQQTLSHKAPYPYIVTIALDGENCWEYYRKDGQVFLNTLYTLLQKDTSLECVTVSEYLAQHPPQDELTYLHPGSWINSDFRTWIGDPTKNLAWDYLKQARDRLVAKQEGMAPEKRAKAWESIYIAEGSDWFWWFGEGHSSNHDHLFDEAFRVYLSEVYRLIGEDVPEGLTQPLEDQVRSRMHDYHHIHHSPISTMQPSSEYYQNSED